MKTTPWIIGGLLIVGVSTFTLASNRMHPLPYTVSERVAPASQLPAGMTLKLFEVPNKDPKPTIAFDITQDALGGWEVRVDTTHFTFTPEHMGGAPVSGEGHVHLYIDNTLILMLGPWYHLTSLTPGEHTIRVALFNNDHSAYAVNGVQVQAEKTITAPPYTAKH